MFASIVDILREKTFVLSAEVVPPRNGAETETILSQVQTLQNARARFISVTRGAGGSLRGGTLPIAHQIQNRFGICALAHFTCRDFTQEEIENELVDHHLFGVHNILALRGDPPDGQQGQFVPKGNGHSYAFQLVRQIAGLNNGHYLSRAGYDDAEKPFRSGKPLTFSIGVAAYPEHTPAAEGVEFLRLKQEAGAQYAVTQMLYSDEIYARYLERCLAAGVSLPIIPGLRVLTTAKQAARMREKFGVLVPTHWEEALGRYSDPLSARSLGIEMTLKLVQALKKEGAPGVHLFVMSDEHSAAEVFKALG